MEVMDCKQQIQRMEERITSEESDSYKIITEILPSIAFQKNYLDDKFDLEQEEKLCSKLAKFEAIENKLKNTKTQIEQKSNMLNNLKPPTLFGKNKYEANKKKMEDEISQLGLEAEQLKSQIKAKEEEEKNTRLLLADIKEKKVMLEKQYDEDEKEFLSAKKAWEDVHTLMVINIPDKIKDGDWETIKPWIKDWLRKEPNIYLYPLIGWEFAEHVALLLIKNMGYWADDSDRLIISGKEVIFHEVLLAFLWEYVNKVEQWDSSQYCVFRTRTYWLKLLRSEDANWVKNMLQESGPDYDWSSMEHVLGDTKLNPLLRELYKTLEVGKKVCIQQGHENSLNALYAIEEELENMYGSLKIFL